MASPHSLRVVVIAPDLLAADEADVAVQALFERSRQLRIGLLQGGFKLVATLPADTYLSERLGDVAQRMLDVADLLG